MATSSDRISRRGHAHNATCLSAQEEIFDYIKYKPTVKGRA